MIHLDTNALIALPHWLRESHPLSTRVSRGEAVAVCAVVWYEFLSGPLDANEIQRAEHFISGRIVPIEAAHARLAADLFNATGRRRGLITDALIAAVAIHADAEFLTINSKDFLPFTHHGLQLMQARSIP